VKTPALSLLLVVLVVVAAPAAAQLTGTVEGQVVLPASVPKRQASRYPGAGAASAQLQSVPAVAWLEGALPAASAPDTVSIGQRDKLFFPGGLAVRAGTVVRFPNDDPFYHNVYSYSGPRFDLGRYAPGTSREVTLDEAGLVEVYCEIHEFMRAVVVVTDHGFGAVTGADGTFRFTDVPPGSYTLKAYHPDHGTTETPLVVTAGATVRALAALGG
jgi:plastocyanin